MQPEEEGQIAKMVEQLLELLKRELGHIESLEKRVDRLGKEEGLALNQNSIEKLRNHFLAVKNKLKTQKAIEEKRLETIFNDEKEKLSKAIKSMTEHFKIIDENLVALDIAKVYLVVKEEDQNIINELEDVGLITNGNLDLEEYKKPENKEKADKILLGALFKKHEKFFIEMGIENSELLIEIVNNKKMDDLHSSFIEAPEITEDVKQNIQKLKNWARDIFNSLNNKFIKEGELTETQAKRVAMYKLNEKATKITSLGRGFLARNRRKKEQSISATADSVAATGAKIGNQAKGLKLLAPGSEVVVGSGMGG